jgi:hypothetical protein
MRYYIYIAVVFIVLFLSRNYIRGWFQDLVLRIKNRKTPQTRVIPISQNDIFSPSGTIRNFSVTFQVEELGNGKVKITIAKQKDIEV